MAIDRSHFLLQTEPPLENTPMRNASIVHATFAATMIGLGTIGLLRRDFAPVWNPVPATVPARELLLYFGAVISLACGIGLLVQRVAIIAARSLLATLLLWLLLFRMPNFLHAPAFEACWSVFPLAVMLAAAWVLYVWLAADWDGMHLSFISGNNGLRIARVLYGLSLIFFGTAHFIDVKDTVSLIPHWLPGHLFWAYFTGCAFIAAGIAVLIGFCARLAAALSAAQIGLFLLLVWIPIVVAGSKNSFQWSETILNAALFAGAWVVADSYRRTSRLAELPSRK
ncbi:MAG TPA: DoxX family membrane protein [Terriglobales bacterium]|nr:DoxX family membrane protein [Terriglobales bacterium]